MHENLTDRARQTLRIAKEQAKLMGHLYVGPEHILIALTKQSGFVARVLNDAGLTPEFTESRIVELLR